MLKKFFNNHIVHSVNLGQYLTSIGAAHFLNVFSIRFLDSNQLENLLKAGVIQFKFKMLIDFTENCFLLGVIDNLKLLGVEYIFNILTEHSDAEAVISAYKRSIILLTYQGTHSSFHFSCRFVGERNAENVCRVNAILLYKICISADEQLGFSASCACDYPQKPLCCLHRLKLLFVKQR